MPREQLLGAEFSDYFTDPGRARAGYEQAFRDGSVHDYDLELRHRDGHTTPVRYNASVYRDASGRVLGVFAAARDITQTRRAQAALRESEERLSAIFEHAPVGIHDTSRPAATLSGSIRGSPRSPATPPPSCGPCGSMTSSILTIAPLSRANDQRLLSGESDTYVDGHSATCAKAAASSGPR